MGSHKLKYNQKVENLIDKIVKHLHEVKRPSAIIGLLRCRKYCRIVFNTPYSIMYFR